MQLGNPLFRILFLIVMVIGWSPLVSVGWAEQRPKLRRDQYGFELPRGAVMRFGSMRLRHPGAPQSLAISPDGKVIASTVFSDLFFWRSSDGVLIRRIRLKASAHALAYSPDGKTVAAGWINYIEGHFHHFRLDLIDVENFRVRHSITHEPKKKPEMRLRGFMDPRISSEDQLQFSISFTPDSKHVVTSGDVARLWDVKTGKPVKTFGKKRATVVTVYGNKLAVGRLDGGVQVYRIDKNEKLLLSADAVKPPKPEPYRTPAVGRAVWSVDGRYLITTSMSGVMTIYDMQTGKPLSAKTELSRDKASIRLLSDDKKVIPLERSLSQFVGLSPDRKWTVSQIDPTRIGLQQYYLVSFSNLLEIRDVNTGELRLPRQPQHRMPASGAQIARDGRSVWTVDQGTLRQWDTATGKRLEKFGAANNMDTVPNLLKLLNQSNGIATANANPPVFRLWDIPNQRVALTIKTDGQRIMGYDLSTDGKLVAIAQDNKKAGWWSLETGKPVYSYKSEDRTVTTYTSATFSWDETEVYVTSYHQLFALDRKTKRRRQVAKNMDRYFRQVLPLADGRHAFIREDHNLHLRDMETGKVILDMLDKSGATTTAVLTPDERFVLVAFYDGGIVHVYETITGKRVERWQADPSYVLGLDVSQSQILTSGFDALLWSTDPWTRRKDAPPGPDDLEQTWESLGGSDAEEAHLAAWSMIRLGDTAVKWIDNRVQPAVIREKQILDLIDQLDDDEYTTRERASFKLQSLREAARPYLRKAMAVDGVSEETRLRCEKLLRHPVNPLRSVTLWRPLRSLMVLEHIGTPEAVRVLMKLASGSRGPAITESAIGALGRLGERKSKG